MKTKTTTTKKAIDELPKALPVNPVDDGKAKVGEELAALSTSANAKYQEYLAAGNESLALAAEAGHRFAAAKELIDKQPSINWPGWCLEQRNANPKFPVIQWIRRLLIVSSNWESKLKGQAWLSSVEMAVAYATGKIDAEGARAAAKGGKAPARKIDGKKLAAALTARGLTITAEDFIEVLNEIGQKFRIVEAGEK